MATPQDATYRRGVRDGRTFLIAREGLVAYGKFEGEESTTAAHENLRLAVQWSADGILVGGGAVLDKDGQTVRVLWKCGTFPYGRYLKKLAKESDDKLAVALRDLHSTGVELDAVSNELAKKIEQLWNKSADDVMFDIVSQPNMDILFAAAARMRKVFEESFPDVDVLQAYADAMAVLLGGDMAHEQLGPCTETEYRQGPTRSSKEASFTPKGASSALRPPHLRELLARLPAVCPKVEELDFDMQGELMTTTEAGAAMAELLGRCPDTTTLGVRETGMTSEAVVGLAAGMPENLQVERVRMSGNPSLLSEGADALVAVVAKLGALKQIRLSDCGYFGNVDEFKQRLKETRPGLRVFM